MKKLLIVFLIFTGINLNAQTATSWEIDKPHTAVIFDIGHFFSTVNGKFTDFEGDFNFDPNNLKESKISFSIPVKSIETQNEKRNQHLLSDEFFEAETYPEIKFTSNKIRKEGENKFVAEGDLRIKGISKKVEVPFELKGIMNHPMQKNTKLMGLEFHKDISRSDFNVGVGDWASDAVIGDKVAVTIYMELTRPKE
ncbi:YceI family protein [Haloflavibacter putidus]|uniref:Polyisoprenoid-binding protein n=1 Tax=Haloflavibacter putidus TaxID=2576776 RepID=A0A507ZP86_9FLAO|nr:YceI family protein [Haloflavibacter putidus]TQD39099.1 polyisoprenoid-binding protein [Haloflavibacter putidus]